MPGEIAAVLTALCWTMSGLAFQWVTKRIGSLSLNLIRLIMAFIMISLFTFFSRGLLLPTDATTQAWIWLSISGIIGLVLGDYFLFSAYALIGARISLLIYSASPILTGLFGYFLWGETLSWWSMAGILLILCGIALVILTRTPAAKDQVGVGLRFQPKGLVYAAIGGIGQGFGIITSKLGIGDYNPVAATQIRVLAGIVGFVIIYFISSHWPKFFEALKNKPAMGVAWLGATVGPFIGVSLSLYAVQHTKTAIASTLMSLSPVLIIPFSIFLFREKFQLRETIGALVAIAGTALLFLMKS